MTTPSSPHPLSRLNECIHHEMMAHVPLFLHPNPKNVLLIRGEGSRGIAREIRRHTSVEHCERVEKDEVDWVERTAKAGRLTYDVICIDFTASVDDGFYANIQKLLAPNGIVISQAGSPFYDSEKQNTLGLVLKDHFRRVHFYNFTDIVAPGGLCSFAYATDAVHPIDDLKRSRVLASEMEFEWYNVDVHEAAFMLPQFQKEQLKAVLNPL